MGESDAKAKERDSHFQTSWTPALERQRPSLKPLLPLNLDQLIVPCLSMMAGPGTPP